MQRAAIVCCVLLSVLCGIDAACKNQVFKHGSKSDCAKYIQRALGVNFMKVDGVFGPETAAAVKKLQTLAGLTADGIVGPNTWNVIYCTSTVRKGANTGLRGCVAVVQVTLGIDPINGNFDAWITESAVKRFQTSSGLTADGIVGKATWAKIHKKFETPSDFEDFCAKNCGFYCPPALCTSQCTASPCTNPVQAQCTDETVCTAEPALNIVSAPSPNHSGRGAGAVVDMIILHYTAGATAEGSLAWMQNPSAGVSAHYLVAKDGRVWRLVEESEKSWHAGVSSWDGRTNINKYSIGIELDNNGSEPFATALMDSLVLLIKDIQCRHTVPDKYIVGHEDIAPSRKSDPGDYFDWQYLKNHGVPNYHAC